MLEGTIEVKILNKRRVHDSLEYLVLRGGSDQRQANWEPITNLRSCLSAIQLYESLNKNVSGYSHKKERRGKKLDFSKVFASTDNTAVLQLQKTEAGSYQFKPNEGQVMMKDKKRSFKQECTVQKTWAEMSSKKIKPNERIFSKMQGNSEQIQIIERFKNKQIEDLLSRRREEQYQIQHQLSRQIDGSTDRTCRQNQLYENVCKDLSALDLSRKQAISQLAFKIQKEGENCSQDMNGGQYLDKPVYQELVLGRYERQIKCEQEWLYTYRTQLRQKFNQDCRSFSHENRVRMICIQDIRLLQAQLKQFTVKGPDDLFVEVVFLLKHKYGWMALGFNQSNQNIASDINDLSGAQWSSLSASFHPV